MKLLLHKNKIRIVIASTFLIIIYAIFWRFIWWKIPADVVVTGSQEVSTIGLYQCGNTKMLAVIFTHKSCKASRCYIVSSVQSDIGLSNGIQISDILINKSSIDFIITPILALGHYPNTWLYEDAVHQWQGEVVKIPDAPNKLKFEDTELPVYYEIRE